MAYNLWMGSRNCDLCVLWPTKGWLYRSWRDIRMNRFQVQRVVFFCMGATRVVGTRKLIWCEVLEVYGSNKRVLCFRHGGDGCRMS
jgi:hypothetical protein